MASALTHGFILRQARKWKRNKQLRKDQIISGRQKKSQTNMGNSKKMHLLLVHALNACCLSVQLEGAEDLHE